MAGIPSLGGPPERICSQGTVRRLKSVCHPVVENGGSSGGKRLVVSVLCAEVADAVAWIDTAVTSLSPAGAEMGNVQLLMSSAVVSARPVNNKAGLDIPSS